MSGKNKWFYGALALLMVLYLLNFTFGLVEILPDALPVVGNVDEAVATGLLLLSLERGFDIKVV